MGEGPNGIVVEDGGEPRIEGRRLTVRRIGALAEKRGLRPETIAERFDLAVSAVHDALAYYYEHAERMDELEAERRARIERSQGESIEPADVRSDIARSK